MQTMSRSGKIFPKTFFIRDPTYFSYKSKNVSKLTKCLKTTRTINATKLNGKLNTKHLFYINCFSREMAEAALNAFVHNLM